MLENLGGHTIFEGSQGVRENLWRYYISKMYVNIMAQPRNGGPQNYFIHSRGVANIFHAFEWGL